MIKTGKTSFFKPLLLLVIFLGWCANSAIAQDLTLEATVSETKIFTGEQFSLSIQVKSSTSHNMALPELPDFDGVRVLSPTPSRSTSVSIINGLTTRTTTYTYSLIALGAGNYTIPSIDINVDGDVMQTNSIPIEVIEKGTLSDQRESQLPDIFLEVELDDENPVVGQQLIASIVLYFKENVEITSYQPAFGWRTDSFWKEEIENVTQPRAESTIKNGVRYRVVTLLRYGLFPSRSGELTLSEYELSAGIRSQARRNDPFGSFFGGGTNQRRVTLESDPVTIQVRSLPQREESIGINAVGDLSVSRSVNGNKIVSGETIEIVTTVTGEGNIPLIQRPEYAFPDGFDKFNPSETSDIERRGMTITGEKRFTELLVSRAPGKYQIPEERVAVYDPSSNRYRYTTLPAIDFEVLPAPSSNMASSNAGTLALQPITGLAVWQNSEPVRIYSTAWFWIFLILPGVAILLSWRKKNLVDKLMNDSAFRRYHTSYSTAQKRLEEAKSFLEDDQPKQVYRELHKAIAGFITDKLQLAEAGLTDQELIANIQDQSVNGEITKPLKSLLDKCNTISYAPVGTKADISEDIKKTEQLLEQLKQKL